MENPPASSSRSSWENESTRDQDERYGGATERGLPALSGDVGRRHNTWTKAGYPPQDAYGYKVKEEQTSQTVELPSRQGD